MTLDDTHQALAAAISAALGCPAETVGGAITSEELRRHVLQAPVALVALSSIDDWGWHGGGQWRGVLTLNVYLVARDPDRAKQALGLVTRLLCFAHLGSPAAVDGVRIFEPTELSASNLYSGAVDSVAVALWGVRWRAPVHLQE